MHLIYACTIYTPNTIVIAISLLLKTIMTIIIILIIDNAVGQKERAKNRRPWSNLNTRLWTVKQFYVYKGVDEIQFVPKPKRSRTPKSLRFAWDHVTFPSEFHHDSDGNDDSTSFESSSSFIVLFFSRLFFYFPSRRYPSHLLRSRANWIRVLYNPVHYADLTMHEIVHDAKNYI